MTELHRGVWNVIISLVNHVWKLENKSLSLCKRLCDARLTSLPSPPVQGLMWTEQWTDVQAKVWFIVTCTELQGKAFVC